MVLAQPGTRTTRLMPSRFAGEAYDLGRADGAQGSAGSPALEELAVISTPSVPWRWAPESRNTITGGGDLHLVGQLLLVAHTAGHAATGPVVGDGAPSRSVPHGGAFQGHVYVHGRQFRARVAHDALDGALGPRAQERAPARVGWGGSGVPSVQWLVV